LEDLDVDGKISEIDLSNIVCQGVYWLHPAQDRLQWGVLINTIMNFRVLINDGRFVD